MNPDPADPSRLRQRLPSELAPLDTRSAQQALSFGSVEELLRHDAIRVEVPPGVEERIKQSLSNEQPRRSWWKKWFRAG